MSLNIPSNSTHALVLVLIILACQIGLSSTGFNFTNPDEEFEKGEGRLCYECLLKNSSAVPTFDIRNQATKDYDYGSACFYHQKVKCDDVNPMNKCFIKVIPTENSVIVQKGCVVTSDEGCTPEGDVESEQICYCAKRLCNSDLQHVGGSAKLALKIYGSKTSKNDGGRGRKNDFYFWIISLLLVYLSLVKICI